MLLPQTKTSVVSVRIGQTAVLRGHLSRDSLRTREKSRGIVFPTLVLTSPCRQSNAAQSLGRADHGNAFGLSGVGAAEADSPRSGCSPAGAGSGGKKKRTRLGPQSLLKVVC